MAVVKTPKDAVDLNRVTKKSKIHLDPMGNEVPDPTPIAPPVGYKRTKPIREQLREMVVSHHLAEEARRAGHETFAESDDFDVDDDFDPRSPFEEQFEPMPNPANSTAEAIERGFTAALDKHMAAGGRLSDLVGSDEERPVDRSRSLPKGDEASRIDRGDPPPEAPKQRSQTPPGRSK